MRAALALVGIIIGFIIASNPSAYGGPRSNLLVATAMEYIGVSLLGHNNAARAAILLISWGGILFAWVSPENSSADLLYAALLSALIITSLVSYITSSAPSTPTVSVVMTLEQFYGLYVFRRVSRGG